MSDLQQNMSLLGTLLPAVPTQVERVESEGAQYIAAARRFLTDVGEKRQEATELMARVRDALGPLRDSATEDGTRLRQGLEAAQSALNAALTALNDGEQDVRQAAEGGVNAMGELQRALGQAAVRGRTAEESLRAKAAAVIDELDDAESELESAVGTAAGTAASVEGAITKGQVLVKNAADALEEVLGPVGGTVESMLSDCTTRLTSELSDLRGAVEGAMDDLGSRTEALVGLLREALAEEREPLQSAVSEVEDAGASLGETALTPVEGLASTRSEVSSGLDTVEEQQTALRRGIEAVRRTAGTIGIDWPS